MRDTRLTINVKIGARSKVQLPRISWIGDIPGLKRAERTVPLSGHYSQHTAMVFKMATTCHSYRLSLSAHDKTHGAAETGGNSLRYLAGTDQNFKQFANSPFPGIVKKPYTP
jgi:hypothetical protein